jgi:hypothetical protein
MEKIKSNIFIAIIFSFFLSVASISAENNQLITEIIVSDNDSTFRYSYLYDNDGNKVLETKYLQQIDLWSRLSQTEWFYQGNVCISQRENKWKNNKWETAYMIDYEYVNEKLIIESHQSYSNGNASPVKKIEFSYNLSRPILRQDKMWNGNNWILTVQTQFTYTQAGKTDSVTTSIFTPDVAPVHFLFVNKYNSDGNTESHITKQKGIDDEWTNSGLVNFFYNTGSSKPYSQRNKIWNAENSVWTNTQKIDYEYDNSNRILSETCQYWKTMYWENDFRYDIIYENNILVKKIMSKPIYNMWRNIITIHYSDFTEGNANLVESRFDFWGGNTGEFTTSFIPYMFNNEPTITKGNRVKLNYLQLNDTTSAAYPLLSIKHEFPVYPNPSNGIYYIDTQNYKINSWKVMDLNGRVLKIQNQTGKSGIIDISEFLKGIYMLQVNTDKQQIIQKLIKN